MNETQIRTLKALMGSFLKKQGSSRDMAQIQLLAYLDGVLSGIK